MDDILTMKNTVTAVLLPVETIKGSTPFRGTEIPEKPTIVTLASTKSFYVFCNYFIIREGNMLTDAPLSTRTLKIGMPLK